MTNSDTSNILTANFAHGKAMLLLLTALGAKKDSNPLLASNFNHQQNRQFRSSKWAPFAANFAAVKYNCSFDRQIVLMLHNGKPIEMPWCEAGSICTVSEISKMFYSSGMKSCPFGICGDEFANAKDKFELSC